MARLEEKLERFEQAVMSQAQAKAQEILSELESIKQEQIALTENAALSAAYEMIQGEVSGITTESARELSHMRLKQKQEYLAKRTGYEKGVFDVVKKRLLEYTATDAYAEYLQSAAKRLASDYQAESVTLFLRNEDKAYEPTVRGGYGATCKVAFSDEITIGGILLRDDHNGFVVDMTLDTRLADQHDWFYQNCKL